MSIATAASLIVVAGLWGATNPFIKSGSKGIESIKASTPVRQFIAELWFLMTNWKYLVPFLLNQSGSVMYYITLASADLSLAVPITNSLTFIFTAISGHMLGERIKSRSFLLCWRIGLISATTTTVKLTKLKNTDVDLLWTQMSSYSEEI